MHTRKFINSINNKSIVWEFLSSNTIKAEEATVYNLKPLYTTLLS